MDAAKSIDRIWIRFESHNFLMNCFLLFLYYTNIIMDDIFKTPTTLERRLDAAHKTGDDGGGTSFVFYDRPHGTPHKEENKKRKLYDPGPPVELHLSGATLKIPEGLEDKISEFIKEATEYEKAHPTTRKKNIDITA